MKKIKKKNLLINLFVILIILNLSCKNRDITSVREQAQKCPENHDSLYNRLDVFTIFANVLNERNNNKRFGVTNVISARGFQIFDLVDTSNFQAKSDDCIYFYDRHVYRFVSILLKESHSNIAYLENGEITIFRSVNCGGDKIEDIIVFLEKKYINNQDKDIILNRVENYRKFGNYISNDNYDHVRDCNN